MNLTMKKPITAFFLIFIFFMPASIFAGKIKLFNKKDLNGWYAFESSSGRHDNALEIFAVDKKIIRLYGNKPGYLMSEQSFGNFKLTVEYSWNTDGIFVSNPKTKNSGVMYLVSDSTKDELWPQGIQFQIKDEHSGDFVLLQNVTIVKNGIRTKPGKSVTVARIQEAEKPIGKWNKIEVVFKNGNITQKLNGKIVNEGNNPSVSVGRILLQYEGSPIDFRKVEIVKF